MSLIGSLEDLGLGDILQIISLSQKSGVLSIRGEDGEGSIVLCNGLVRGACLKGGPADLRGLLVGGRFLEADEFDSCCERARREGTTVDEALVANTDLDAERIDSLRRESVEAAVMTMFAWRTGEFSFDVRSAVASDDPELFLPTGINAQYLAMEGSRIEDESAHIRAEFQDEVGSEMPDEMPEVSAEEMFGVDPGDALSVGPGFGEPLEADHDPEEDTFVDDEVLASPIEALGLAVANRVDADPIGAEPIVDEAPGADTSISEPEATATSGDYAFAEPVDELPAAIPSSPSDGPLVVIDPDLVALEWLKRTLRDAFPRIHIFQRWDLGLNPIRQYLARANRPVVLLRPEAKGDPLSGIRDCRDFVTRLKAQQPRLLILWLHEDGAAPISRVEPADGVLTRPSARQLRSPRAAAQLEDLAVSVRQEMAGVVAKESELEIARAQPPKTSPDSLHRLKQATDALADASTRGEVLPLVIRFASEVFDRVAMFMLRGDSVVGMAQNGLPAAGGPDDAGLRQVSLDRQGCAWFRNLLESRRPVRSGPTDGGDYTLAALLGSSAATESYLAPIESGGEVVAMLYADNLPGRQPLGDSKALEVVLQHAGLALERAVLERALAEAEGSPTA